MVAAIKLRSEVFSGISYEQAYLKGCKSLCKAIQHSQITFNVSKLPDEGNEKSVQFDLFVNIDMSAAQKEFCKVCKEFHCSFYINEEYNCARCNLRVYLRKLKGTANVSKGYFNKTI